MICVMGGVPVKNGKNVFMLSALLCLVQLAVPAFAAMKNEPDKFRGIPWRMKLSGDNGNCAAKLGLEEDGPAAGPSVKVYGRRNEKLSFGEAEILEVYYFFQKSLGFAKAQISAEGQKNFDLIRAECIKTWGPPDEEKKETGKGKSFDNILLHWSGKRVIALLIYDKNMDYITLYIYLNNYHQTVRSDEDAMLGTGKK